MLRHAFRRLLWVVPSVLGVSILTFLVLSWLPDPLVSSPDDEADATIDELRRQRFLHLPLFVNPHPQDARSRTEQAVQDIASAQPTSEHAERGRRELSRLGGVSLPFVLPKLDSLPPEARTRIALALAPIGKRMGVDDRGALRDPKRVVLFWTRFWETRGVEFRAATARSAVRRYARYGSEARADEIRALDTFALNALVEQLEEPTNRSEVARVRRLLGLAAHVTGRDDRVPAKASVVEAAAAVERWRSWWGIYQADYVPVIGAARFGAIVVETRFGKWAGEVVFDRFGKDELGRPIFDQLVSRGRVSLTVLLLALALAYAFAIPLGALSALFRGTPIDWTIGVAVLVPFGLSPAVLGVLAVSLGWMSPVAASASPGALIGAALVVALALLADPTRHQRSALISVLTRDFVLAAVARGAGPWRVVVVHGLRNALFPLVTRIALELPAALTAVFVLERAFGLPGLGETTLAAVGRGDMRWLMALTVCAAAWAVVALVLSDVGYAVLDPRLRSALLQSRRRQV